MVSGSLSEAPSADVGQTPEDVLPTEAALFRSKSYALGRPRRGLGSQRLRVVFWGKLEAQLGSRGRAGVGVGTRTQRKDAGFA